MIFDKVIIVGGTNLLYQIADMTEELSCSGEIEVYECNTNGIAKKGGDKICYKRADSKQEIMSALEAEKGHALVLSVMNPYILSREVVEKENLLVVNLHHALLPRHRGRNAEAWAIYEGDTVAGITWHKVNAGVDTGDIYLQKEVPITEKTTSLKLLTQLNGAALEGFRELLAAGFENITPKMQDKSVVSSLHLAKDIPNNGWLDLSWTGQEISRFLRAMDYGILNVMGKPKVKLQDGSYTWKSYKISASREETDCTEIIGEDNTLRIVRDGMIIILNKLKRLETKEDGTVI